jgi:hypothetical protein
MLFEISMLFSNSVAAISNVKLSSYVAAHSQVKETLRGATFFVVAALHHGLQNAFI